MDKLTVDNFPINSTAYCINILFYETNHVVMGRYTP